MSLATEYGQSRHRYLELIEEFPLRHIKNDRELDRAIRVIDSLLDKVRTNRAERDYLDALSTFVEAYEEKQHPIEAPSDAQMLEHLISARGVTQSEVAAETDIAESTISAVLHSQRQLTREHISRLATYFCVSQGVFVLD